MFYRRQTLQVVQFPLHYTFPSHKGVRQLLSSHKHFLKSLGLGGRVCRIAGEASATESPVPINISPAILVVWTFLLLLPFTSSWRERKTYRHVERKRQRIISCPFPMPTTLQRGGGLMCSLSKITRCLNLHWKKLYVKWLVSSCSDDMQLCG